MEKSTKKKAVVTGFAIFVFAFVIYPILIFLA